uniref:Uncharacterized protein n=1 Tax=Neolamprologus brichardi TaxID=32507 RepID=A0A3Q4G7S3_NEOBR
IHLMLAVREEVELLREQIRELQERNRQLERENHTLRASHFLLLLLLSPPQTHRQTVSAPPTEGRRLSVRPTGSAEGGGHVSTDKDSQTDEQTGRMD